MEPLRVTARLESGIAHATPWGAGLEGILASERHYRDKAERAERGEEHTPLADQDHPVDLPLPLARCERGPDWHWAATCAWPVDGQGLLPDVQPWMAQVDHRAVTDIADESLQKVVDDQRGRWRSHLMPLLVTSTTAVTWSCVGEAEEVRRLLEGVMAIGKKRAHGQGRVLAWEVDPSAGLGEWAAAHLHPDGTLGRPCAAECLDGSGSDARPVDRAELVEGWTGLRPPVMHSARQRRLLLPAR